MKNEYYEIKQPSKNLKVGLVAVFVICALCFSLMFVKPQSSTSDFMFLVDDVIPESNNMIDNTQESNDRIDSAPEAYNIDGAPQTNTYENITTCNASEIILNLNDMQSEEQWQEIYTSDMSCEPDDYCTAFLSPLELSERTINNMQLYNKARIFDTAESAVAYFENLQTEVGANYTINHYNIGDDGYLIEMDGYIEISYVKGNVIARMCVHGNLVDNDFDLNDLLYYINIVEARIA